EYQSSIYYPYALMGYLNLYDFSPDSATRALARAQLDYYLATYALSSLDGVIAGAQRRGYLSYGPPKDMEKYLWLWSGAGPWALDSSQLASKVMLHPYSSGYRPHPLVYRLLRKEVPLPYEAYFTFPSYHLERVAVHPAYLYMSEHFALGSVLPDQIDNPAQQVCWSLVLRDSLRPRQMGGGHPRYPYPSGHSPYTQTLQQGGTLLLLTGQHTPLSPPADLRPDRLSWFEGVDLTLKATVWPEAGASARDWIDFLEQAPGRAETWFYVPKGYDRHQSQNGTHYLAYDGTYLAVVPVGRYTRLDLPALDSLAQWLGQQKSRRSLMDHYEIWVTDGPWSGFVLEAVEAHEFDSFSAFITAHQIRSHTDLGDLGVGRLRHRSLSGTRLDMQFAADAFRPRFRINGRRLDWDKLLAGAAIQSPLLQLGEGRLRLTDGQEVYEIQWNDQDGPTFLDK
ncbi:MAG: hypothetical protein D6722_15285, partial [Bacteroidetes bacterium]